MDLDKRRETRQAPGTGPADHQRLATGTQPENAAGDAGNDASMGAGSFEGGKTLITLSAASAQGLWRARCRLRDWLRRHETVTPAEVGAALIRRAHHAYRLAQVVGSRAELLQWLEDGQNAMALQPAIRPQTHPLFLFSPQGRAPRAAIQSLNAHFPIFAACYQRCQSLWPGAADADELQRFALPYGLYHLLQAAGLTTQKVIGGGIGRMVIGTILGKHDLAQGLAQAHAFSGEQIPADLNGRLAQGAGRELAQGLPLFLELGRDGTFSEGFRAVREAVGDYPVLSLDAQGHLDIPGFFAELYRHCPSFDPAGLWQVEPKTKGATQSAAAARYGAVIRQAAQSLQPIAGDVSGRRPPPNDALPQFLESGRAAIFSERLGRSLALEIPAATLDNYGRTPQLSAYLARISEQPGEADIAAAPRAPDYPLSPRQMGLWMLQQMDADAAAYNMCAAFRIEGKLDVPALKQAICSLVRHHEILRTTYIEREGIPRQRVLPAESVQHGAVTLTQEALALDQVADLIRKEAQTPFDLENGPILRGRLQPLDGDGHLLLLGIHHIAGDNQSVRLILDELAQAYAAQLNPRLEMPAPPRLHYKDFSHHLLAQLAGGELEPHRRYWHRQLAHPPAPLNLPADHGPQGETAYSGQSMTASAGPELSQHFLQFCSTRKLTPFIGLLGLVKLLLFRQTGDRDIIVGAPIAGRTHRQTQDLVGFFVNMIPLRDRIQPTEQLDHFLARVKQTATEAYDHQDFPFDLMLETQAGENRPGPRNLFDVMVTLQQDEHEDFQLPGCKVQALVMPTNFSKYKLSFYFKQTPQGVAVRLEYNADLFEKQRMTHLLAQFFRLMASACEGGQQALQHLDILPPQERALRLARLQPQQNEAHAATYPQLLQAQMQIRADEEALIVGTSSLTYRRLQAKVDRLAGLLRREHALGPDMPVGLMMPPCEEMVVAMLAILQSGGAYVPLDPQYPQARIAYILKDSGAGLLLSHSALSSKSEALDFQGKTLFADKLIAANEAGPAGHGPSTPDATATNAALRPDHLAYVTYTSGSTGKPKGVMISHRNLAAFLPTLGERFGLGPGDTMLSTTTISFDISVLEILLCLAAGVRVVLADADMLASPQSLLARLASAQINAFQVTPSRLTQLLEWGDPGAFHSLKLLLVGGEGMPADLWQRLAPLPPAVHNVYGPTETTIWSSSKRLQPGRPTIGTALPNEHLLVLSPALELQPQGVPGEICIGGTGLARGYHRRAALTAERFIPHPWLPGARLYRTGDLGCWLPNGELLCLGRLDHQVKIRGHRIETGEIEHALQQYPGVQQALAVAMPLDGRHELVAYLRSQDPMDAESLRRHLADQLPAAMVPARFVQLQQFPMTPNGKIDRNALPAPSAGSGRAGQEYAAPRNELERLLASHWEAVLGIGPIGIHDNFFSLGGHSLKATRIVARLYREHGIQLRFGELFRHPTVAALAKTLTVQQNGLETAIPAAPDRADEALSPAQQRMWILHALDESGSVFNMPLALSLRGPLDAARLEQALTLLVQQHETLRTTFHLDETGSPRQRFKAAPPSLQRLAADEDFNQFAQRESMRPFDLLAGEPPWRLTLHRTDAEHHHLFLNMHHLIGDGLSLEIFCRDLLATYDALCDGRKPQPQPMRTRYRDYAAWQRHWLAGETAQQQRQYWLDKLRGAPEHCAFPTDHARPASQTFRGARLDFALTARQIRAFEHLCRELETSSFTLLTALVKLLLFRTTGVPDTIVGIPVGGRLHPGLEHNVGLFMNTLALRDIVEEQDSFAGFLAGVRNTLAEALLHQAYPFDKLVGDLNLTRDLAHSPLFNVLVSMVDFRGGLPRSKQLDTRFHPLPTTSSKLDISFHFGQLEDGLHLGLEYNSDLFEPAGIRRLAAHFTRLLESACADPQQKVTRLALMSEAERQRLPGRIVRYPYAPQASWVDLFGGQVAQYPERTALIFRDRQLSYRQLDNASDHLAHLLAEGYGVGAEDLVCVMLPRSERLLVTMIAVLKCGAAFVPIDPTYPPQRVAYLIEDAGAKLLVSEKSLQQDDRLSTLNVAQLLLDQDDPHPKPDRAKSALRPAAPLADFRAYVTYTSGSTGRPKGVMVTHRNLLAFQPNMDERFGTRAGTRLLATTTVSFDISILELLLSLTAGLEVEIAGQDLLDAPHLLLRHLATQPIAVLQLTPSRLQQLLAAGSTADLARLQRLLIGGEALPRHLSDQVQALGLPVFNVYGPTETTIWSSSKRLDGQVPTIGNPLLNEDLLILDGQGQPQPPGLIGEICIGGSGVARGYHRRPGLTAERFVPHPLRQGERVYRTGDLGRLAPNGGFVFLGRMDNQVKIRGHRIECGEIEYALMQLPGLREAVVVPRSLDGSGPALVAYLRCRDRPEPSWLREKLRLCLPDYMLPAFFVFLDHFPLTPNRKIDKKALPDPKGRAAKAQVPFTAPRNTREERLAAAWNEVLQCGPVGIHDNFFDLGGDSIKGVQVITRLYRLGYRLDLAQLFRTPVIAQLADHLPQTQPESSPLHEDRGGRPEPMASTPDPAPHFSGLDQDDFDSVLENLHLNE